MMRKKQKSRRLSFDQKIEAASMVFIDKETQATTARHFRVTVQAISKLVCKLRKNPEALSEVLAKREAKEVERE